MPSSDRLPVVQAVLLCDYIYRDARTGKHVLAGTFNLIFGPGPEFQVQRAGLYVNLVDLPSECELVVRLVQLSDASVLMESQPIRFKHSDPLQPAECVIPLPPIHLPKPGVYAMEVLWGPLRTPLASVRLQGRVASQGKDQPRE